MALAHTLGFPRIGADRELKKSPRSLLEGRPGPGRVASRGA